MPTLLYLVLPAIVVIGWCCFLWLRQRKPQSLESGIDDFQREMRALAPEQDRHDGRRRPGGERSSRR